MAEARLGFCRWLMVTASLALLAVVAVCYALRPDAATALTIFPVWMFLPPGLVLAWAGYWKKRRRPATLAAAAWVAFVLVTAEEPRSLLRTAAAEAPQAVRVASVNCAGGDVRVAEEALSYEPDILLLQEAPAEAELQKLVDRLGKDWSVLPGPDAVILARGAVEPVRTDRQTRWSFVEARVRLSKGTLEVFSLRLHPAPARFDLWSPDAYRTQARIRDKHREELAKLASRLERVPPGVPIVVGGDFNAVARDRAMDLLRPRLRDLFPEAGRGWGDTFMNDLPLIRIDQIWASEGTRCLDLRAHRTVHSDHRLVVANIVLPSPREKVGPA